MNSACLRKSARNDSVLSFGTTKVLARTMGPAFSLNCANIGVCGWRLCSLAIFGTSYRYRSVGVAGARVLRIPAEFEGVDVRVLDVDGGGGAALRAHGRVVAADPVAPIR